MNDQLIAQPSRPLVINLRSDHDRVSLGLRHGHEAHPELLREERPSHFDEAQIDDIMNHPGAVRIEKHHLDRSFDTRSLDGGRLGR